jgi:ABC-2 type transport system permease protein
MHDGGDASRLLLTVVRQASVETLSIMQHLSALQTAAEGKGPSWIAAVRPLQTSSIKRQTLPTWILMMVLLVSFIVLPAQVAEEKEKQLLLGWMQTPVRENEWLVSKLAYGIVLMLTSVVALQWMGRESSCAHGVSYLAMLCAGGFCFGALGICLGLLCRNQASARTLGVLCYLPLLLPAALSDMSQELRSVAPLVPSYRFYEPIRAMLLEDSGLEAFAHAWISLVAIGLLACLASHRLIKKRWLM